MSVFVFVVLFWFLGVFFRFFFAGGGGGGSLDRKVDFSTSDILKHSQIKPTRASVAIKLAKS